MPRGKDIDYELKLKDLIIAYPSDAYKQMLLILTKKIKSTTRWNVWENNNPVNSGGLLEYAIDYDREDLFKLILSYKYIKPFTILQYAAATKNAKYLELLLANKEEKFLIPDSDLQPEPKIDVNFFHEHGFAYRFSGVTALCCAAKTDDSTCLQLLLKEPNIDLNLTAANSHYTPLFAAMYRKMLYEKMEKMEQMEKMEKNVNILINDDRLYERTPLNGGRTSLLVAAQIKSRPPHPLDPDINDTFIVCQNIISRLLYKSKHTKAQLALNIIDMDGNSVLSGACKISDLKLFKYFLYANGWGTKIDDTHPEKLDNELDWKISPNSPNNAENWTASSELFRNFLNMNDALRSSRVAFELSSQDMPRDASQFFNGRIPHSSIQFIFDTINAFYVRDTNRDLFLNILASPKITQFVESGGKDDIQECMVELLKKIREYYGIK